MVIQTDTCFSQQLEPFKSFVRALSPRANGRAWDTEKELCVMNSKFEINAKSMCLTLLLKIDKYDLRSYNKSIIINKKFSPNVQLWRNGRFKDTSINKQLQKVNRQHIE